MTVWIAAADLDLDLGVLDRDAGEAAPAAGAGPVRSSPRGRSLGQQHPAEDPDPVGRAVAGVAG